MPLIKHVDGVDIEMTPEEEADFLASVPPPPNTTPPIISDRQFYQNLAVRGIITQAEALAAVGPGTIPPAMAAFVAQLPQADQFAANMLLTGATEFNRYHPIVPVFGQLFGWSGADIDLFWTEAYQL
jgi:hypothetical protein